MAIGWVDICNMAIIKLGAQTINNLSDSSVEARTCAMVLEQTRQNVLASYPWNCAVRYSQPLARIGESGAGGAPLWPFRFAYSLPSGCLRVLGIQKAQETGEPYAWRLARHDGQAVMLCDHISPSVAYIGDIESAAAIPAKIREVLIYSLAADLALPLTEGLRRAQEFEEKKQQAMQAAILADAAEGSEPLYPDDTYVRVRQGASSWRDWA